MSASEDDPEWERYEKDSDLLEDGPASAEEQAAGGDKAASDESEEGRVLCQC